MDVSWMFPATLGVASVLSAKVHFPKFFFVIRATIMSSSNFKILE